MLASGNEYKFYLAAMKKGFFLICCCITVFLVAAQTTKAPFQEDIRTFRKSDSSFMPAKRAILFVGSSSFTKWKDVGDYFPGYPIINRGFGGSSLTDLIRYSREVILAYQPRQIIIYCGENDIAAGADATTVLKRFQQLFTIIRTVYATTPVQFISIKPSPSRWKYEPVILEANQLIRAFLARQTYTGYIDIHPDMLNENGSVRADLFVSDQLHMNAKGYTIWQKRIAPVLSKNR